MSRFYNNTGIKLDDLYNVLASNELKFREKGIYVYLLSKSNAWIFSAERIAEETQDNIGTVKTSLRILESKGLLKRNKIKNERGLFAGMDYEIFYKEF